MISATFDDVIVQKEPAAPMYFEHSFVTWRSLSRSEDADTEATPVLSARVRATKARDQHGAEGEDCGHRPGFHCRFPSSRDSLAVPPSSSDRRSESLIAKAEKGCPSCHPARDGDHRAYNGGAVRLVAQPLHVSVEPVMRDWRFARAWLSRQLKGGRSARA